MGSQVVLDAVRQKDLDQLIVADYNLKQAKQVARRAGGKAKALFVDANFPEKITQLVRGSDCVISCIGPFYEFEEKVAKAVIQAGVSYVSLCDDYDATEKVLKLNEMAVEKGVTVISGCGWTPGLSNILAHLGIEKLEDARHVRIAWSGDAGDSEGLAVIQHTLHIFTGKVKTYCDGRHGWVSAGSGREYVSFPEPIGTIPVFHVGHPEPITLPRVFPQLKNVSLKGGLTPSWLNGLAMVFAALRLTDAPGKTRKVAELAHRMSSLFKAGARRISGLVVEVSSEDQKIVFKVIDKMRRLTGIPASIVGTMCARGEIRETGVQFPEGCVPAHAFMAELAKRGIQVAQE